MSTNPAFAEIQTNVWSDIFKIVFFPDRIYHDQYLNATRSPRYRYNVHEVRGYVDITVLKGEVYLDGLFLTNFVRVEYRGGRLVEQTRTRDRFLGDHLIAWLRLTMSDGVTKQETRLTLHWDAWVETYQAEIGGRWSLRKRASMISWSST